MIEYSPETKKTAEKKEKKETSIIQNNTIIIQNQVHKMEENV